MLSLIDPATTDGRDTSDQAVAYCSSPADLAATRDRDTAAGTLNTRDASSANVIDMLAHPSMQRATQKQHERARPMAPAVAQQLDAAREAERARLARELHDELGAHLTVLQLTSARLSQCPPQNAAEWQAQCAQLSDIINATQQAASTLVARHQPPALDDGLIPALRAHVRQFAAHGHVHAIWRCDDAIAARLAKLTPAAALTIYRIAQESLTNVARHAHATRVVIALDGGPQALTLSITDDGVGLPRGARRKTGHFGLTGMRERCAALGGRLRISSTEDIGTTVSARLPWHHILSGVVATNTTHLAASHGNGL